MTKFFLVRREYFFIAFLLLTTCAELGVYYPPPYSSPGPARYAQPRANQSIVVTAGISVVRARQLAAANNLTGLKSLPPGIRRNLQRGKPLPRGIARRAMPEALLAGLPSYPNHDWRIAGKDLVLIALGTLLVVDILNDVFE